MSLGVESLGNEVLGLNKNEDITRIVKAHSLVWDMSEQIVKELTLVNDMLGKIIIPLVFVNDGIGKVIAPAAPMEIVYPVVAKVIKSNTASWGINNRLVVSFSVSWDIKFPYNSTIDGNRVVLKPTTRSRMFKL